jgi:hypothetical protein
VSTDQVIEERLTRTFSTLAGSIPARPPINWSEAKEVHSGASRRSHMASITSITRRKSTKWALSIVLVAGLAGTGAAAASGVFNSKANEVLHQLYSVPVPASWGRLPAFNPKKEKLAVTDPGPEGTTISVWTYAAPYGWQCLAVVDSKQGEPTFPGKRTGEGGGCSGSIPGKGPPSPTPTLPPGQEQVYGTTSGLWRSPTGKLYYLVGGSAPATATKVVLTFADGSTRSIRVQDKWFGTGISQNLWSRGWSGKFYGPSGEMLPGSVQGL